MKKHICLLLFIFMSGCSIMPTAKHVINEFEEANPVGPGSFADSELQWSHDGKYLAFVDVAGNFPRPGFYDIQNNKRWLLEDIWTIRIAWHPSGRLSYLEKIPNVDSSTYPLASNLHIVDLDGQNNEILVSELEGRIRDFVWFENGENALIIIKDVEQPFMGKVYLLNIVNGQLEEFLEPDILINRDLLSLSLSKDESKLIVWSKNQCEEGQGCVSFIIIDMQSRYVIDDQESTSLSFLLEDTIESLDVYSENATWLNNKWVVTKGTAILPGDRPFSSIVFINTEDIKESIMIEATNSFGGPTVSPSVKSIAYINHNRGQASEFITIAPLPDAICANIKCNQ